jgi:FkbH-like protein
MRLVEALETLRAPVPDDARPFGATLACGFTPLHLRTFVEAELRRALPERAVGVEVGLFDDLLGTVRAAESDAGADALLVVVEWADLDPRLGLRRLGGWRGDDILDVVDAAEKHVDRLQGAIAAVAETRRVVVCLPTLPLPPVFVQRPSEAGAHELSLRALVASLGAALASQPGVRVAAPQALDLVSPPALRHDPKAEVASGFPYTLEHASAVAAELASLAVERPPLKGLITDLDETLWAGIVGEVGAANVSWSDAAGSHHHALYQQFLASLADAGVLVAVASKNDPTVVDEVFEREDLLLSRESVFPVEVHWESKSTSVERILRAWNVAADAVAFVDDSPAEIAQVQAVFPDINGVVFPGRDLRSLLAFLRELRELFGKHETRPEDRLRLQSLRSTARFDEATSATTAETIDTFLQEVDGTVRIRCQRRADARALELVNKTNQFNLNGRRLADADVGRALSRPGSFLVTAAYDDKFGPLGEIAAIIGHAGNGSVAVDAWVMSCRAFSRRIEHHCLSFLLDEFGAGDVVLDYAGTARNEPLRRFLTSFGGDVRDGEVRVSREAFRAQAPALVHRVEVTRE